MSGRRNIDELGVFTGKPLFSEPLVVGRPNVGDRDVFMTRVNDILDRRWFTNNGKYVQELEGRIAKYIGVKHCIAMCNATVALEIAVRGVGMTGEVIVPSFTFVATPHSLQWQQITPVFCDIDPVTHNLDPYCVEKMITPRTTGIIGVHVWGRPCAIEDLTEIAKRRGLKLMFDAAHAFACSHNGRMIGSFGDAEVFSFHATKFFNTFEGGAVTTNDDALAARIRRMKNFGFAGYDNVDYIGTNGKMSEMSAAMGITTLEALDGIIEANWRNYRHYRERLEGVPGVRLIDYGAGKCNFQYIVLEIDEELAGVNRDQLVYVLHKENVLARRYFYPGCHQMEPYRSFFPHAGLLLPNTERLTGRVMSLPNGTSVGGEEVNAVCDIISLAVKNGSELSRKLSCMEGP